MENDDVVGCEISTSEFAAFLADELSADRRAELTRHLADNKDARELLIMAYRALKEGTLDKRDRNDRG